MKKPKHTELPYKSTGSGEIVTVKNYRGAPLIILHLDASQMSIEEAEANAAFLVRAANNHYKLEEVRRAAEKIVAAFGSDMEDYLSYEEMDAVDDLKAALLEAEKEA